MKKYLLITVLITAFMMSCFAEMALAGRFETITVADTAVGIGTQYLANQQAFCTLATAEIRFRIDGENPTSAVGHIMSTGSTLVLSAKELVSFKAIRTGGDSGVLSCTYY